MLKPRERNLLILTIVAVGGFVFYYFVGALWWEQRTRLGTQKSKLVAETQRAQRTLDIDKQAQTRWAEIRRGGLKASPSEAETQLVATLQSWSQQSGLKLTSSRQERTVPVKGHDIQELIYQFSYTGNMRGVSAFLYRLESTDQPLRVRRVDISTANEGQDSLRLQLTLSALCSGPAAQPAPTVVPTPAGATPAATQMGGPT